MFLFSPMYELSWYELSRSRNGDVLDAWGIRQTSDDSVAFIKPRLYDSIWYAFPPYICDMAACGLPLPKNITLL
jgi:hypothetical protein